MKKHLLSVFCLVAILALVPAHANAHTTGASWISPQGSYTIDVGYDPTTFTAGQYTRFDFMFWKGPPGGATTTGESAPFDQVWVRIINTDTKDTLLATGILHQPLGPTTLLFQFTQAGSYKLETSFRDKDGNDSAVGSFPITVQPASGGLSRTSAYVGAGFVLGILCAWIVYAVRSRKRSPKDSIGR